jgi:capsid protein
MGIIDNIRVRTNQLLGRKTEQPNRGTLALAYNRDKAQPSAYFGINTSSVVGYSLTFNGEKNLGEMGPVIDYQLDHYALRARAMQLLLESDVCYSLMHRLCMWIVGGGLRLQANPTNIVLKSEGITIDKEPFNELVEARWESFCKHTDVDWSGQRNLHQLEYQAMFTAALGGDVLVILRYDNAINRISVQLIDGALVSNLLGSQFPQYLDNGNYILNGVEMNEAGEHIAYYVKGFANINSTYPDITYTRIPAYNEATGLRTAFLVYGNRYKIQTNRGLSCIASCMNTLKQMDEYKGAALASAVEVSKISYQIIHNANSNGENPLLVNRAARAAGSSLADDLPADIQGTALANLVTTTTNKTAINMPVGAELKTLQATGTIGFKEFWEKNFETVSGAMGIPPNVARMLYDDNYSASRAAIQDWKHTIDVMRKDFSVQFKQRIYDFWLHIEVLRNKVQVPGYLPAFVKRNSMALGAIRNASWRGSMFPHIDPLKEVNAVREMLGPLGANIPLISAEEGTNILNGADSDSNMEQFAEELKFFSQLIAKAQQGAPLPDNGNPNDDPQDL